MKINKANLFRFSNVVFFTLAFLLFSQVTIAQIKLVTIQQDNISIKDLLEEIRKQSGYDFVFTTNKVDLSKRVHAKFKNTDIMDVLDKYFNSNTGVVFTIENKTIILVDEQKIGKRTITGKITDDRADRILAGATIRSLNGKHLVRTDNHGDFSLTLPENIRQLEVFYIGYKRDTIQLNQQSRYPIHLTEATETISEVVVTGLFERSAQSFTGAVNTITAEDIRKAGNQNILDVLAILDPSIHNLQDLANGSDPNKIAEMRLRGASSLPTNEEVSSMANSKYRNEKDLYNAYGKQVDAIKNTYSVNPNLPLFILDGFEVPIERINDLDINEIQSVTILKDASATSIYGSRGANGVIVMERIKPKAGQILFSFKSDLTYEAPDLRDYDLLNAAEKLQVEQIAGVYNSGYTDINLGLQQIYNERLKEVQRGRDTFWPALPLRNAFGHRNRIGMEGGAGAVTYGIGISYNNNPGVMKGSSRDVTNGSINLSYRTNKILINNQLSIQYTNGNNSPWGTFSQYTRMNPYFHPYDENGNIPLYLQTPTAAIQGDLYSYVYNPLYNTQLNGKDFRKSKNLMNNTAITYYIKPNLSVRGRVSVTNQTDNSEVFLPSDHTSFKQNSTDIFRRGAYTAGYGKFFTYDGNLDLNYNLILNKHQIYSTLNTRISERNTENVVVQVDGLPSPLTDFIFYGRQYVGNRPSGNESTIRSVGFLGNLNYTYDNRYLADFSYRLDGASNVGSDKQFSPFWSAGLGWNIHSESFFKNLTQQARLSQLRLRSSIGITGAQQFDSYMAYRTYNYSLSEAYLSSIGANLMSIGNEDLTWQATQKFNIGLDAVGFYNRLSINADYYYDFTDKFIADFSLQPSVGFATYKGNLGSIKSRGYEVRASFQAIQPKTRDDLGITLMGNLGHNSSVVDKISEELKAQNEKLQSLSNLDAPFIRFEEGKSLDAIWVVPSLGIDPATGRELFQKKDGSSTFIWDSSDMISAGLSTPKLRGTFGFTVSYAGFNLTSYFSYRLGGQQYNSTLLNRIENVNLVDNADRRVLTERWINPGDVKFFKAITKEGASTRASSRFVQDESTVQMTSASLLYRFDPNKIKKYRLRSLNLGFYMNDLFRISSIQTERGLDYPFARTFSFSLQTSF